MNTMEEKSKAIATNRKVRYEYEIIGNMEAGLVLVGSEVKALREGRVNISDAYARVKKGELWIIGMHISPYKQAAFENHEPLRERKALLRKQEIKKLFRRIEEKGVTLIPLRVYFKNKWAKVDLGIARGKRKYDKKETIAQRDAQRDLEREQKKYKFKM
jgi:SsrA-binding protein